MRRLFGLILCCFLSLVFPAQAEVAVPALKARLTDLTGTFSAEQRSALESELQGLESRTGSQLAVLLLPSTQPESIEQYSIRVVESWKLGQKGKDNGILLLVAKNDRKVRIEVGYGLEGNIPDVVAKRIIEESITPLFRQGDLTGGIKAGVQRLATLIEGSATKTTTPPTETAEVCDCLNSVPEHPSPVMDLTGSLSGDQEYALSDEINKFYDSGRTKPIFVLIVPSTQPEPIAQYAERTLQLWGEKDNLDVDRSILLVVAKDDGKAHIAAGNGLQQRMTAGASEKLVAEIIEPQMRQGELAGAVQSGVKGIEGLIDAAIANKPFSESLADNVSEFPLWLLAFLAAFGSALRWVFGPLFGALLMAGLLGGGAWLVSEIIEVAVGAGFLGFIFVLVGFSNWVSMALSGGGSSGGSSSGGGGFSGGGGSFGGGGASGSW